MPHRVEEVEWLEAFCRAVRYMEDSDAQQEHVVADFDAKCVIDDGEKA